MNCKQVQNKLIFVIEGNLQSEECAAFLSHIEYCEECNYYYNKLKASIEFLNEDKLGETNPFFASRVMASLEKKTKQNLIMNWITNKQYALQVLSYTFLAILGIFLGNYLGKDKISVEPKIVSQETEISDNQLFAESYQFHLNEEDLYIIKAEETQE